MVKFDIIALEVNLSEIERFVEFKTVDKEVFLNTFQSIFCRGCEDI